MVRRGIPLRTSLRPVEATRAWEAYLNDLQGCVGKVDIENLRQGNSNIQVHCEKEMVDCKGMWEAGTSVLELAISVLGDSVFLIGKLLFIPLNPNKNAPFLYCRQWLPSVCQCEVLSVPCTLCVIYTLIICL